MSQPFDFDTPINENTTLVARYRCGDAPYAGQWFRATTVDGKQYVPATLEEAKAAATTGFPYNAGPTTAWALVDTSTGLHASVDPTQVVKLEFGGGWGGEVMQYAHFFEISSTGTYSSTPSCTNLRYITGYPEGAIPQYWMFRVNVLGASKAEQNAKLFANLNIDLTGFKFDKAMWQKMTYSISSSTQTVATIFEGIYNGDLYNNVTSTGGVYGIIEPLFSPSEVSISTDLNRNAFSGTNEKSLNYTKGTGFVGQYAAEWVEKFPTLFSIYGPARTTYLG